jgi:DNA-binding ferritin-like protein (Dps family)
MGPAGREDVEVTIAIDRLKDFEWQHAITNFRFVDSKGKVLVFGAADQNQKIYDNASDDLAKFIDDMIAEVNKENKPEEVEKIEGNSEGSLD